ncbi:MAG: 3'(2'),5'-bisphosphate nucleotidase CysQ [Saprospiraceae bacterium]
MRYNPEKIIQEVIQIAQSAGDLIMEVYEMPDFEIENKLDDSPITKADKASNNLICKLLTEITPGCPIISEENELPEYEVRSKFQQYWLVDPLDGTKEFINRNGEFAVNIALLEENRPVLGVVYLPVYKEMYCAIKGQGAWKIKHNVSNKINVSSFKMNDTGLIIAVTRSHFNQQTADFVAHLNFPCIVEKGSAIKMLMIAEGKAHIHPRFGTTMEWDTAAPQIIVEEAGGEVLQHDQTPVVYNKENLKNPDFVVFGKLIY